MAASTDDRARPVWNLREGYYARSQLDELAGADARFDQIWASVRWLIIRDPIEAGQLVPGRDHTYVLATIDFLAIGIPEMLVTYSIIDEESRLLEVVSILSATEQANATVATAV